MLFLILLILCSQLWCPSLCPPARDKDCVLSERKLETGRNHQAIRKSGIIRRTLTKQLMSVPKENETFLLREQKANTTTVLYWNMTHEKCDYERIRCLRAYATGAVCARTLYYHYYTFPNYCTLEFHNCLGRYDGIWMLAYMGMCIELDIEKTLYPHMTYEQAINDTYLKQMYVDDSGDITNEGHYN